MSNTIDKQKQISVLFADDDEDTLQMLEFEGKNRGWSIETATNVSSIIEKVNKHCENGGRCFDAIVADLHYFSNPEEHYPKLTGVTAARSIRKVYQDIPIIFVTGYSNILVNEEAKKYSNEIIIKPVDIYALFDRIEYYIFWHKSNDESDRCCGQSTITKSIDLEAKSEKKLVTVNSIITDSIQQVRETIKYLTINKE